ncbi:MAG TPA: hypothetical protein VKX17_12355 [Planctomycetota bacterium]|nr:hypothetical protein [Planctomycetota bacterium]
MPRKTTIPNNPDGLNGLYFHTFEKSGQNKGIIENQGQIVAAIGASFYVVQLFSFATGLPTNKKLVPIDEMTSWKFYDNIEELKLAYEKAPRPK